MAEVVSKDVERRPARHRRGPRFRRPDRRVATGPRRGPYGRWPPSRRCRWDPWMGAARISTVRICTFGGLVRCLGRGGLLRRLSRSLPRRKSCTAGHESYPWDRNFRLRYQVGDQQPFVRAVAQAVRRPRPGKLALRIPPQPSRRLGISVCSSTLPGSGFPRLTCYSATARSGPQTPPQTVPVEPARPLSPGRHGRRRRCNRRHERIEVDHRAGRVSRLASIQDWGAGARLVVRTGLERPLADAPASQCQRCRPAPTPPSGALRRSENGHTRTAPRDPGSRGRSL